MKAKHWKDGNMDHDQHAIPTPFDEMTWHIFCAMADHQDFVWLNTRKSWKDPNQGTRVIPRHFSHDWNAC